MLHFHLNMSPHPPENLTPIFRSSAFSKPIAGCHVTASILPHDDALERPSGRIQLSIMVATKSGDLVWLSTQAIFKGIDQSSHASHVAVYSLVEGAETSFVDRSADDSSSSKDEI
jgi:hypothetical protein